MALDGNRTPANNNRNGNLIMSKKNSNKQAVATDVSVIDKALAAAKARNEAKVADHLFYRKEMDTVYTLDEATLFDFLFHYLREIDVFPLLENLDPQTQQRENIPFLQFVLIYLMKVIGSIPKMEPVWELLLTDELLMGRPCLFRSIW